MKTLTKIKTLSFLIAIFIISTVSCNKECEYNEPCIEFCQMFEDFEDDTIGTSGNWKGKDLRSPGVTFELQGSTTTLLGNDGSGDSYIYNNTDFPSNLIEAGCELRFDVEYIDDGGVNGATARDMLIIYDGTSPLTGNTTSAKFKLFPAQGILTGSGIHNITVPLELGIGTTLPSNIYGEWILGGLSGPPTATDVNAFNILIQNIGGLGFRMDVLNAAGESGPFEKWWFDNFCFQQCCPSYSVN